MNLSVIVPVYNVEKYLDKCLDSLVHQDVKDYEIIVVNDGTKDNSQEIVDRYVKAYPFVKSYIKENGGLSSARNYGLKYATGKYVTFLDSDDYIEYDLYKKMYEIAENEDCDLVVGDVTYEWEDGSHDSYTNEGIKFGSGNDNKDLFLSPLFSWNKFYRRSLFEELECRYPEGLWYEDIPVTLRFFAHIKKVGYYYGDAYHYMQRSTSIMASPYSEKMYDIFTVFEKVVEDFKTRGKYDEFKDELEYLFVEHFLVYGAFRFLRTDHYKELMGKAFGFVKNYFPNYKKNKYIVTIGKKNELFFYTNNETTMHFWHWFLTR